MILERMISGGQTGADEGALIAAKGFGLATGGWLPKGCRTERGPRRELLSGYGMQECLEGTSTPSIYRIRALYNVRDSDGTLCFDLTSSTATDNAYFDCERLKKPFRCVMLDRTATGILTIGIAAHHPHNIAEWIVENRIKTLNVCGNRASKVPDIGELVEKYLAAVFRLLREGVA